MDTRGRPGDRRIDRPSLPPARASIPSPIVEDVELVELTAVERRRRGIGTTIAIGAIAAATTLIVGLGMMPPLPPAASPGPSSVAVASGPPSALVSPSVEPTSSRRPLPTTRATPIPSRTPTPTTNPAAWRLLTVGAGAGTRPIGFWDVNEQLIVLAQDYLSEDEERWRFLLQEDGADWYGYPAPRAVASFAGGVVHDDRLWFATDVSTVSDRWVELLSTGDGRDWQSHGRIEVDGQPVDGVSAMVRAGGRWVILAWRFDDCCGGGAVREYALVSTDGDRWREVDPGVPDGARTGARLGVMGDRVVLLGGVWKDDGLHTYAATSEDGTAWTVRDRPLPLDVTELHEIVCRPSRCFAIASVQTGSLYRNLVLTTGDGLDWSGWSTGDLGMPGDAELIGLTTTDRGFLLTIFRSDDVWLFDDDATVRVEEGLILNPDVPPLLLVRRDEVVFGIAQGPDGSLSMWRGLLGLLAE